MDGKTVNYLKIKAAEMRVLLLDAIFHAQSGHPGGSLSSADIIAYLYFNKMRFPNNDPKHPERDRFVLSKGHACPALYSALAVKGFIPKGDLNTFRSLESYLQGHPDMNKINGVDMSTGSLGQGFSAACGMAVAGKIKGSAYFTYAIIGDGESEEGQVWEAAMFASHYKLDNLVVYLDLNYLQIDGDIRDIMNPTPLDEKFKAFGWEVALADGHDFADLDRATSLVSAKGRPGIVICRTTKGKGVSFMENNYLWHGRAPKGEEYETAKNELADNLNSVRRGDNA